MSKYPAQVKGRIKSVLFNKHGDRNVFCFVQYGIQEPPEARELLKFD